MNKNKKYLKIVVKYDTINQIHCKKEIIKRGNYFNNNDIEIIDNNWFEIDVYEKDTTDNMYELTHDEVLDIDIHTLTPETLKQYMINHLEYYIEDIKEESKSNDDIDMEMEE